MDKLFESWRNSKNFKEKALCVYDFDHTLVHTSCCIRLRETKQPIPQAEYESRVKSKGFVDRNEFDFSDYGKILDPEPIEQVVESLKTDLKNGEDCWILTARQFANPIAEYLPSILENQRVPVVAVSAKGYPSRDENDHEKKAGWIRGKIYEGYRKIRFYEDSHENANAVWALKEEFPHLELEVYMISQSGEIKAL